jgi:hypothetical protein
VPIAVEVQQDAACPLTRKRWMTRDAEQAGSTADELRMQACVYCTYESWIQVNEGNMMLAGSGGA